MAEKVGFIGLGMMGNPMSKNLLKAGFELTVWNRTESKMKEIVDQGAKPARSAKEVAEKSEVTITMVSGPADVEEVVLGKNGFLEGAKPGSVLIDMSTIATAVSKRVAAEVAKKGVRHARRPGQRKRRYCCLCPSSGRSGRSTPASWGKLQEIKRHEGSSRPYE
jgi:2-hydroxy-3-oxopropionate reductase